MRIAKKGGRKRRGRGLGKKEEILGRSKRGKGRRKGKGRGVRKEEGGKKEKEEEGNLQQ